MNDFVEKYLIDSASSIKTPEIDAEKSLDLIKAKQIAQPRKRFDKKILIPVLVVASVIALVSVSITIPLIKTKDSNEIEIGFDEGNNGQISNMLYDWRTAIKTDSSPDKEKSLTIYYGNKRSFIEEHLYGEMSDFDQELTFYLVRNVYDFDSRGYFGNVISSSILLTKNGRSREFLSETFRFYKNYTHDLIDPNILTITEGAIGYGMCLKTKNNAPVDLFDDKNERVYSGDTIFNVERHMSVIYFNVTNNGYVTLYKRETNCKECNV